MLNPYVDPLTALMDWPRRGPGSAGPGRGSFQILMGTQDPTHT